MKKKSKIAIILLALGLTSCQAFHRANIVMYVEQGRSPEALSSLEEYIEKYPHSAHEHCLLAHLYQFKDLEKAARHLLQAHVLEPDNREYIYNLNHFFRGIIDYEVKRGLPEEAIIEYFGTPDVITQEGSIKRIIYGELVIVLINNVSKYWEAMPNSTSETVMNPIEISEEMTPIQCSEY